MPRQHTVLVVGGTGRTGSRVVHQLVVSTYTLHEGLVNGIFAPGSTSMANIAHFMCELVINPDTWAQWSGKLPVIVNAVTPSGQTP